MKKQNVMVIFGGKSGEHQVSLMSAASILRAINREKYNVVPVGITRNGRWQRCDSSIEEIERGQWETPALEASTQSILPQVMDIQPLMLSDLDASKIDVVFPVLHGPFGEDGTVQGLLEILDLPYVGAGVLASAVAMDKGMAKKLFQAEGIPQADYLLLNRKELTQNQKVVLDKIEAQFTYPVFIKPANLGSSVGISKAKNRAELIAGLEEAAQYDRRIVVEAFVDCREIECAVLGNDDPKASLPAEIIPSHEFYDYHDKYFDGTSQYLIPAALSAEQIEDIRRLAVQVYQLLDCSGLARVDFFVEKTTGKVLVNEVNTMPGFTKISMYPKMWEATGLSYEALIDQLIQLAIERKSL